MKKLTIEFKKGCEHCDGRRFHTYYDQLAICADCSDDFNNVMIVEELENRIQSLESAILDLYEVMEFYGNKAFDPTLSQLDTLEDTDMINEKGYLTGIVCKADREWCGKNQLGGKRARTAIQKHQDLIDKIKKEGR